MSCLGVAKCFHSLSCNLMISIFISLCIQSHVNLSEDVCGNDGELETGNGKCEYTDRRIWAFCIFYGAVVVFLIGAIGNCQSNGWIIIIFMASFVIYIGTFGGLVIHRMSSERLDFTQALDTITYEMIRDKWDLYATILKWSILVGHVTAFTLGLFFVYYFINFKHL